MKLKRINTSSFGISEKHESHLTKYASRHGLNLLKEYLPLARLMLIRVEESGEGLLAGTKAHKKTNYMYFDLVNGYPYFVFPKSILSDKPRLKKINLLKTLIDLPPNLVRIVGFLLDRGSTRYEAFNQNELLELKRYGLIKVYEPKANKIANIFRIASDMREISKYYVKLVRGIPGFMNSGYDLSKTLCIVDTIDASYTKRRIEYSIEKVANLIRNLFMCDVILDEICYLPRFIVESPKAAGDIKTYFPVCYSGSSGIKRGYPTEEMLKPIALSIDTDVDEAIPIEKSAISFDDVGGLKDAKREIMESIVYPFTHPDAARRFGRTGGGGILLYGPPGCGKTQIARATVTECGVSFFNVNIGDILSGGGNEAERIHEIFEKASKNAPAILFFDEIDALCSRKDDSGGVRRKVLNQFLMDMSGVEGMTENVLVIAATDTPWDLDPALRRSGRFSRQIFIPPPDFDARIEIFRIGTRNKPLEADVDFNKLAGLTEGYSAADIIEICKNAARIPWEEEISGVSGRGITMNDFLSAIKEQKSTLIPWAIRAEKLMQESGEKEVYSDLYQMVVEINKKFHLNEGQKPTQSEHEVKKLIEITGKSSDAPQVSIKESTDDYDELYRLESLRSKIESKILTAKKRFKNGEMDEEIYLNLMNDYQKQLKDLDFKIKLLTFK